MPVAHAGLVASKLGQKCSSQVYMITAVVHEFLGLHDERYTIRLVKPTLVVGTQFINRAVRL